MKWNGGRVWGVEEVRRSETGEQAREGVMWWDKSKVGKKGRKE